MSAPGGWYIFHSHFWYIIAFPSTDGVFNALEGATVEVSERKIIWPDAQALSIEQSVERLHKTTGLDRQAILSHLIGWLQMEYEPQGLDEDQMQRFEKQIDAWVAKYDNALPSTSDS